MAAIKNLRCIYNPLFISVFWLGSCATITSDALQPIEFVAPGCVNVPITCEANNKRGNWVFNPPETVYIRRSDDHLKISCRIEGASQPIQSVPSRLGGKIVASAVFLDFGIVDAITDKHREYPAQIVLTTTCPQAQG